MVKHSLAHWTTEGAALSACTCIRGEPFQLISTHNNYRAVYIPKYSVPLGMWELANLLTARELGTHATQDTERKWLLGIMLQGTVAEHGEKNPQPAH